MMLADRCKTIRRGVTLVELLIVVSIITILAAIALPAMQTGMEGRRIREATRAVHVYFGSAQVRAIENGRPVGVLIERSKIDPRASVLLRQVEVPPPYAGDFDNAGMRVQDWTFHPVTGVPFMPGYHVLRVAIRFNGEIANGLIQPSDMVQLNHQGPFYEVVYSGLTDFDVVDGYVDFTANGTANDTEPDGWTDTHVLTLRLEYSQVASLPWPIVTAGNTPSYPTPNPTTAGGLFTGQWSAALPFQIIRNPVPSAAAPLKLPRGMVIDLDDSGYGDGTPDLGPPPASPDPYPTMAKDSFAARDMIYDNTLEKSFRPVLVMFGPDGGVEQVYHSYFDWIGGSKVLTYGKRYIHGTIFLMIGRADRTWDINDKKYLTPPPEDGLENWEDAGNLWLALNPQTGRITVAEVNADLPPAANRTANTYIPSSLEASRAFARQAQVSMRGR